MFQNLVTLVAFKFATIASFEISWDLSPRTQLLRKHLGRGISGSQLLVFKYALLDACASSKFAYPACCYSSIANYSPFENFFESKIFNSVVVFFILNLPMTNRHCVVEPVVTGKTYEKWHRG